MLNKKPSDIKSSEITDQKTYLNRRLFMRGAALAGTVAATGLVYRKLNPLPAERWSQGTENRIREFRRRDTLLFNGYAEQVAHLYQGMDLRVNF